MAHRSLISLSVLILLTGCAVHTPVVPAPTVTQPAPARVMAYDEYGRVSHPAPYILEIYDGGGELLYFGSQHIYSAEHPQREQIENLWRAFRPTLAFNEGGEPRHYDTAAETVSMSGESGLVRFLAARHGVLVRSLEPSREQLVRAYVAAGFSAQRVKVYEVLLAWISFRRSSQTETPDAFVTRVLGILSMVSGLEGPPHTPEELADLYAGLFPATPNWRDVPDAAFDPVRNDTFFNELARLGGRLRDQHMVDLLCEAVGRRERVFAVAGCSHVVMQEPALRGRYDHVRTWTLSTAANQGGVAAGAKRVR